MSITAPVRRTLSWVARIAFIVILVGIAFWKADVYEVFRFVNAKILIWVLLVQPIAVLNVFFFARRFSVLLQSQDVQFGTVFKAIILANGLNVFLPARLSEVLKATYLQEKSGYSISKLVTVIVLERIGDVLILIVLVLASVNTVALQINTLYIAGIGVFLAGSLLMLAGSEKLIHALAMRLPFQRLSSFLKQFASHAAVNLRGRSFYIGQFYGVLGWSASFAVVYLLMFFLGSIGLSFSQSMVLFAATTAGLLLPLLPGGIGTFEAAGVYVLKAFGYGFSEALVLSVVLHVAQLLLPVCLALVIVASEKTGISALLRKIRGSAFTGKQDPDARDTKQS